MCPNVDKSTNNFGYKWQLNDDQVREALDNIEKPNFIYEVEDCCQSHVQVIEEDLDSVKAKRGGNGKQ